ncbi:50S ribosomal protein L25/general stress protein Ctc [Perlabentimonas gracilis]|uniref:50S ribosomal protein L25/general stress protein Ctc n=1 Tax=Perlabentimonas gracilis TaxID=2715279 RepID=UPI00140955E9|nr:50S ribosomal protein L25/general stress protein Ctc [Perlabentimonas gracilis]NHB69295.1 50S ribosomal protein L25/general stress protein Ctc [Perlabentimonas gracilis]
MKEISLNGSVRTETGKKFAKQIRREERVPAIVYGGKENLMVTLVERELKDIIYTPHVYTINLNVDGKAYKAIVKEMQFHPVTDKILHLDLLQVFDDKKLTVALPVKLTGSAEGAKQGGKLTLTTRKLRVCGFPKDLPEMIEVDVTELGLGKSRLVSELSFDKFDIVEPKSTVIATVKLTRAARGAAAAAAETK